MIPADRIVLLRKTLETALGVLRSDVIFDGPRRDAVAAIASALAETVEPLSFKCTDCGRDRASAVEKGRCYDCRMRPDPLHPNGRCTCAGEMRADCPFCGDICKRCLGDGREPAGIAETVEPEVAFQAPHDEEHPIEHGATLLGMATPATAQCPCSRCLDAASVGAPDPFTAPNARMILCPKCGNKRCPKAAWHGWKCSGSNELDQGSPTPEPGEPSRVTLALYSDGSVSEWEDGDNTNENTVAKLDYVIASKADEAARILAGLIESLPKCTMKVGLGGDRTCQEPATRAYQRGGDRYCDRHGGRSLHCPQAAPEYPRAEALREAVAYLERTKT